MIQCMIDRDSLIRVQHQTFPQKVQAARADIHISLNSNQPNIDVLRQILLVFSNKGHLTDECLKHGNTETVHIDLVIVGMAV